MSLWLNKSGRKNTPSGFLLLFYLVHISLFYEKLTLTLYSKYFHRLNYASRVILTLKFFHPFRATVSLNTSGTPCIYYIWWNPKGQSMHPKLNPLGKVNYTHTRHVPRSTAVPTAPQSPSAGTQVSQPTPIALESYDSFIFPLDVNFI